MLTDDLRQLDHDGATQQERAVISHVLAHPGFVETCTAKELAQASFVSAPTVVRLCKKLGFSGFPEFKLRFVTEQHASANQLLAGDEPLVEGGTLPSDVENLMTKFYNRVIYETGRRNTQQSISRVAQMMSHASCVDIYGSGGNLGTAQSEAFRLQTMGIQACAYDAANVHVIERLTPADRRLSIIISHTGRNPSMVEIAHLLENRHLRAVAITLDRESELAQHVEVTLQLFSTPSVDRLSLLSYPLSLAYLFDLLYATLLSPNLSRMFQGAPEAFYPKKGGQA